MTEIQLPKGWVWAQIGKVCNNFDGKRIPLSKEVRSKRQGEYRYYGATEIVDYIDSYIFEGDYILIGEDGANLLSKSKPLSFIVSGRFWVNNHAHIVQPQDNLDIRFFNYYFNSLRLNGYVTGSAQPKLTQANLNKITIPLPPLPVQQAIVVRIEELYSELEAGTRELQTALARLKTYRQAVIDQALDQKDKDWQIKPLGTLATIRGGVTKGRNLDGKETVKVPYLRVANVQDGYLDLDEIKTIEVLPADVHKYKLEDQDILFTEGGDKDKLGRGTVWSNQIPDCIHQNHIFRARVDRDLLNPVFLTYTAKTTRSRRYFYKVAKQTTNLASINLGQLSSLEIPLPNLTTQTRIVSNIEARLSEADAMETTIRQELARAENLRQSILKRAFAGQLVTESIDQLITEDVPEVPEPASPVYGGQGDQLTLF